MSFSLEALGVVSIIPEMVHAWFLHRHRECRECRPFRHPTERDLAQLCQTGRKLMIQWQESLETWRGILPHLDFEFKDAWDDYDNHKCPAGEIRCTVKYTPSRCRPVPKYYREVNCSVGYKLADERFGKLGY